MLEVMVMVRRLLCTMLEGYVSLTCLFDGLRLGYSLDERKSSALYTKPSPPPAQL